MDQKHTAQPVQFDLQTNYSYSMNQFSLVNQQHSVQPVQSVS